MALQFRKFKDCLTAVGIETAIFRSNFLQTETAKYSGSGFPFINILLQTFSAKMMTLYNYISTVWCNNYIKYADIK